MRMSKKTVWYFSRFRRAADSVLLVRKLASMPAERRILQISSALSGSSSTTRIRAGKLSLLWQARFLEVYARSATSKNPSAAFFSLAACGLVPLEAVFFALLVSP